jgi:hypothetical protein
MRSTPVLSRKIADTPPSVVGHGNKAALTGDETKLSPSMETKESGATVVLPLAADRVVNCRSVTVTVSGAEVLAANCGLPL